MLYTTVAYGAATAVTRVLTFKDDPNVVVFYMFALNRHSFSPGLYTDAAAIFRLVAHWRLCR